MVTGDPFSPQANFISRLFVLAFMMLEVNCLYLIRFEYVERDWVIFNCVFFGMMLLGSAGSFTL